MVFANKSSRQESKDDFRASQSNEAHELFECNAMTPIGERLQDVLRSRILSIEKPDVCDAERRQGVARFDLPDVPERRGLLGASFIRAAAATRADNHRHTLVFVQRARKIRCRGSFIVRMRHHEHEIHFVALVGRRQRGRLLRCCPAQQHTCCQRYDRQCACES